MEKSEQEREEEQGGENRMKLIDEVIKDESRIGIIGDGAEVTWAPVILIEGKEKNIGTEELVLINNLNGNKILAVCRRGYGRNPGLSKERYSPGRAYARVGELPSPSRESFDFDLSVIGEITGDGIRQNKLIIAPRSEVYMFKDKNPFELMNVDMQYEIGYYKDHKEWKVPALVEYIPYHIGVFCTTGWGKTSLVRHKIIPLLRNAEYSVLVFDWKGDDYVPHFSEEQVIKADDISAEIGGEDIDSITSFLLEKTNYCGSSAGSTARTVYTWALREALKGIRLNEIRTGEELKKRLLSEVPKNIEKFAGQRYREENKELFRNYFEALSDDIFEMCLPKSNVKSKKLSPEEIIERAKKESTLIIDLSGRESDKKLETFLDIARILRYKMDVKKEKIGIALIIDEAPQYCPYKPEGLEKETTNIISDLCALGRSYKLPVVLISQGMSGEIGINAAVRRNINTWFIGKIHPLDREEAKKLLPRVDLDFLQSLDVGHFYFFGNMSPSPVPLLIRFEIDVESG